MMKKLLYTLACMLLASAVSVPFAAARDANRDAIFHILAQQRRQEQRWEAVVHSTGAARREAMQRYLYSLPSLWDDQSTN